MVKKRMYIDKWLAMRPHSKHLKTDSYYLNLANEVYQALYVGVNDLTHFAPSELDKTSQDLACVLTCYFEDVVSEFGMWQGFSKLFRKHYGKLLPFYDTSEYYEDEINIQDVCFLIWNFLEQRYRPFMVSMLELLAVAKDVMEIFDEKWEVAPENEQLKDMYRLDGDVLDVGKLQLAVLNMFQYSYLNYPYSINRCESVNEYIERLGQEFNSDLFAKMSFLARLKISFSEKLSILPVSCIHLLAEVLGEDHQFYDLLSGVPDPIDSMFKIESTEGDVSIIRDLFTDKEYRFSNDSIRLYKEYDLGYSYFANTIYKLGDVYHCVGPVQLERLPLKEYEQERKDYDELYGKGLLRLKRVFLKHSDGEGYILSKLGDAIDLCNEMVKQAKLSSDHLLVKGKYDDEYDDVLIFFNPQMGLEVILNGGIVLFLNVDFSDPDGIVWESIREYIQMETISREFIDYCFECYADRYIELCDYEDQADFLKEIKFLQNYYRPNVVERDGCLARIC